MSLWKTSILALPFVLLPGRALAVDVDWQSYDKDAWEALEGGRHADAVTWFQHAIDELDRGEVPADDFRRGRSLVGSAWAHLLLGEALEEEAFRIEGFLRQGKKDEVARHYEKACQKGTQALPITKANATGRPRQRILAKNYHLLGRVQIYLNRWEDAERHLTPAREVYAKLGDEPERLSKVLSDLASLRSLFLDFPGALEYDQGAFKQTSQLMRKASITLDKVDSLIHLGRYPVASQLQRRWKGYLDGPYLPKEAPLSESYPGYELFAYLSYLRGDFDEAEELLDEVCRCGTDGKKPSCYCSITWWLIRARILVALGNYDQAEEVLERVACDGEDAGLLRWEKQQIKAELALDLGQYAEAAKTLKEVIQAKESELGEKHPGLCNALLALARAEQLRGDKQRCVLSLCDRVVKIHTALQRGLDPLPVVQPEIGRSRWLKGVHCFYNKGEYMRAAPISQDGHKALQAVLVDEHPDRGASLDHLARVRWALGRFEDAERLAADAFDLLSRTLPSDHYRLAESHATQGWICHSQGSLHSAEHHFRCAERVWDSINKQHNRDHPGRAEALIGLAVAYEGMAKSEGNGSGGEEPLPGSGTRDVDGLLDEAERLLIKRLETTGHAAYEWSRRAQLLEDHDRLAEATLLHLRAFALYKRYAGNDQKKIRDYLFPFPRRAFNWCERARLLEADGRLAEATALHLLAYDLYEAYTKNDKKKIETFLWPIITHADAWYHQANKLAGDGRWVEARLRYRCALRLYERSKESQRAGYQETINGRKHDVNIGKRVEEIKQRLAAGKP
ncbi:tetratricopeptide repeat protein [Planctomycetota bacterium]